MAKVRPLLRLVNRSLQQFGIFSKNLSVDEQMVPYFGRHSCKMFIKGKPIRFGYKQWILCSSSGYPFNIDIYCGKTEGESTNVPLGTRVVLNALKCVDVPTNHVIFMDNFFTSHALLQELKERGFRATGTVREVRLKKCPLPDSKELASQARGSFDFMCDGDVLAVKWNDNRISCTDVHRTYKECPYPIAGVLRSSPVLLGCTADPDCGGPCGQSHGASPLARTGTKLRGHVRFIGPVSKVTAGDEKKCASFTFNKQQPKDLYYQEAAAFIDHVASATAAL
ncbi:hypothetical protein HPB49_019490 [Dermacentor silvarum]|uniref:Uncharacterized protein n=1 Tax=Dermacentor silvarum TaxID=543639 RepID=A0ACB8E2J6_DERSI|nr:hypothetical protein HPB49_019490 [Dermacentor silvarum]